MNISEIARKAGVSSAAVSRYFNSGYLSKEKKEAIERVVNETGYRPSAQAQTLRTKRTKMIGVIAPRMVANSIASMVEGIQQTVKKEGYHMLLGITGADPEEELEYLTTFNHKQVDGVLLMGTVFTEAHKSLLKELTVPIVILGQRFEGYKCVYHDDYHAVYDMTKELLQSGRKNLGLLSAKHEDISAGLDRYRGYCDAVRQAGCASFAEQFLIGDFHARSGYEKARELLEKYPDLDCIVCASDEQAIGAYRYLKEQNIRVPEEIVISGVGDSEVARAAVPSLRTVHLSYETCGRTAAEMLFDEISSRVSDREDVCLGYHMIYN